MKIVIIHDWLVTYAGAERVLEQMLICYPDADLFSVVDFLDDGQRSFLNGKKVQTTFIQKLPGAKTRYRSYLPLMPLAIEQLELSQYDLILSSSHAVAKGVLVSPDQLHLCMCYTPIRYAWDLQNQYLQESDLSRGLKSWAVRWLLHKLRLWDVRSANGVDRFIAISHYIARRIQKAYRRDAVVIYPPVDTAHFELQVTKDDFYITTSRMVPYKKIPLIVEAFSRMPDKRLVVIGNGPEFEKCQKLAGPNVILLRHQSAAVVKDYLQRAKAFVFAAEEDFGIAPIEAQACGTPVIAFGKGAILETIRGAHTEQPTGLFFETQTVSAIIDAVSHFETMDGAFSPQACRDNALRFSVLQFRRNFVSLVSSEYASFQQQKSKGTC
jgi:glycosyltransferase involved in cell wall biosynthesis